MTAKITLLGGSDVGGSATLIQTPETTFLVDYGMIMDDNRRRESRQFTVPQIPEDVNIDFVLITHAHLDHSGGVVEILKKYYANIVASEPTFIFAEKLLRDSYRTQNDTLIPTNKRITVEPNREYKLSGSVTCKFIPAGHTRGASSILVKVDGKKILFSGDISNLDLPTVAGFKTDMFAGLEPDMLFLESTYGGNTFPSRENELQRMVDAIKDITSRGGNVLVPAFSFGRAQDVALELAERGVRNFIDGKMSIIFTQTMNDNHLLWGNDKLYCYHNLIRFVRSRGYKMVKGRRHYNNQDPSDQLIRGAGNVVVAASGWLLGGKAMKYLKYWLSNPQNAVFFPGPFQKYTAADLLDPKVTEIRIPDPEDRSQFNKAIITVPKKAKIDRFLLSSHADQNGLAEYARAIMPKKIILCHGSAEARAGLQKKLELLALTEIAVDGQEFEV